MSTITHINEIINNIVWGVPAMICVIGVGTYLSILSGFIQFRKLVYALKIALGKLFVKTEAAEGATTPLSVSHHSPCCNRRNRKYCRCSRCNRNRWCRCGILDVDCCNIRYVH